MNASKTRRFVPSKNVAVLGLSLALGGAGVYLTKDYIEDKVDTYRRQLEKNEEMVKIVVPKRPMLRGETVRAEDLALRSIPASYAHPNSINEQNYAVVVNQRLNFDIAEGRELLWAHLAGALAPTFSGGLAEGKRGLTIPVDEVNSISGFLQPKDKVDLLLTYKSKIHPIMQNLHVLATGVKTVVDNTGAAPDKRFATITVEVTPKDAERIVLAQSIGKITATLRHPEDAKPVASGNLTVSDLLGMKKPAIKKVRRAAVTPGVEYIIGGI